MTLTQKRDDAYDPHDHAEQLGIDVVYGRLRTANGLWIPDRRTIILKQRMRATLERSVLAHELGHVCLGHREETPRNERQADIFAARHLVDVARLRAIANLTNDQGQWCVELGITPRILETYLHLVRAA